MRMNISESISGSVQCDTVIKIVFFEVNLKQNDCSTFLHFVYETNNRDIQPDIKKWVINIVSLKLRFVLIPFCTKSKNYFLLQFTAGFLNVNYAIVYTYILSKTDKKKYYLRILGCNYYDNYQVILNSLVLHLQVDWTSFMLFNWCFNWVILCFH